MIHPGGDTRNASWGKTVKRARREAEGLRVLGFEVKEPDDFQTPPHRRIANTAVNL